MRRVLLGLIGPLVPAARYTVQLRPWLVVVVAMAVEVSTTEVGSVAEDEGTAVAEEDSVGRGECGSGLAHRPNPAAGCRLCRCRVC